MIAVLLLELSDWSRKSGWRTMYLAILAMGLIGFLLALRPEWCCELLTVIMIWCGLTAGEEYRDPLKNREGITASSLDPWQVLVGKILAALVIGLLHLLAVLPAVVLMVTLWGVPWWILAQVALVSGSAMIAIAGLSIFIYNLWGNDADLFFRLGVGAWMAFTVFFQPLQWFNPFILVWRGLQPNVRRLSCKNFTNMIFD
ncbi:MAG TPA: hypothetical protein VF531_00210 [Bacillota bacterium]